MDAMPGRLLCVDLQPDAMPDADQGAASAAARKLLTLGRRLGWTIAHTRRRTSQPVIRTRASATASNLNPLMTEQVFFHEQRSVADSPGLTTLLHSWRTETVLIAAFDPQALMSLVLACHDPAPRLVLVEDVFSLKALRAAATASTFHGDGWQHAFAGATLASLIARANRSGVHLFPAAGEHAF